MPTIRRCPNCGTEFTADAPEGLCPKCLLRGGLNQTAPLVRTPFFTGSAPTIHYLGDYELDSEIARGGMGVVYKARQLTLNRPVAVKMILAGHLADDMAVGRFYAEAEAAANLKHRNIVAIHEVGEHDGQHYFSMDYIEGRNLAEWAEGKPVAATHAATLVKSIAEAIHYAHQRGTLHRDLKPSNVLIDVDNVPHITDFGLAKIIGDERNFTQTGAIMGTPNYMPPEQATGRHDQIGPHSDVYAMGAILYELLTGQPPFQSASSMETLLKVIESEPAAPRARNPEIPTDLEIICLKCLEKSPHRRYHSARDLAEDLDRFIRHEPIHARPASMVRKAASWTRRHPGTLAAAAALLVFGLAACVFYLAEENAFLRAEQATPGLARQPGPRTEALEIWKVIGAFLVFPTLLVAVAFQKRAHKWRNDPTDPGRWARPLQPVGRRLRAAAACLGMVTTCVSVILLAKSIEAFVWEGAARLETITFLYIPGWAGIWLMGLVWRDYRLTVFGRPAVTTDQLDSIESELVEYGRIPAIKLYRQVFPDASLSDAKAYVDQLESDLCQSDPQKHSAVMRKSQELNWRLMAICACVEAAALIVLWLAFPANRSVGFGFACGFAIGLIPGALVRQKGKTWQRIVAIVLVTMIGFFLIGIVAYYCRIALNDSPGSFLFGMLFGVAVMISGFTPRRQGRRQLV